jgi:RNA polymerase sigma factor (sigma-70 family)
MAEPHTSRRPAQTQPRPEVARQDHVSILHLARSAAAGDERAIGILYERRFALVYNAARAATGRDEHFCLDVVQESFLRVLRAGSALGRFRDSDHVDRWLIRIAQASALDLLRAERRRAKRERRSSQPETARDLDDAITHLNDQLSRLSPEERTLLRLRSTGMTLDAIAETVGASIGVVHGRLRRLFASLRSSHKERDHD